MTFLGGSSKQHCLRLCVESPVALYCQQLYNINQYDTKLLNITGFHLNT